MNQLVKVSGNILQSEICLRNRLLLQSDTYDCKAVSYTHLDVYKRQLLDTVSVAEKLTRLLPPDISVYRVCRVKPEAHAQMCIRDR